MATDEENNDGLKEDENDTLEDQSDSENEPAEDGLKDGEEDVGTKAEKLLDGTSPNKKITVKKERFDDLNGKAKLYEAHAPLLDKVLKDPEAVEKFLDTENQGDLESRMARLEEANKAKKRVEMRTALSEALTRWPDLEKSWSDIKPIVDSLVSKGHSFAEALSRGYIATHPEAAGAEAERITREGLNRAGSFSSGGARAPKVNKADSSLSDAEKQVARALGKSEEEYAKLLEKHKDWMSTNFRDAQGL